MYIYLIFCVYLYTYYSVNFNPFLFVGFLAFLFVGLTATSGQRAKWSHQVIRLLVVWLPSILIVPWLLGIASHPNWLDSYFSEGFFPNHQAVFFPHYLKHQSVKNTAYSKDFLARLWDGWCRHCSSKTYLGSKRRSTPQSRLQSAAAPESSSCSGFPSRQNNGAPIPEELGSGSAPCGLEISMGIHPYQASKFVLPVDWALMGQWSLGSIMVLPVFFQQSTG